MSKEVRFEWYEGIVKNLVLVKNEKLVWMMK